VLWVVASGRFAAWQRNQRNGGGFLTSIQQEDVAQTDDGAVDARTPDAKFGVDVERIVWLSGARRLARTDNRRRRSRSGVSLEEVQNRIDPGPWLDVEPLKNWR